MWAPPGSALTASMAARTAGCSASRGRSRALNWDWPPGLAMNTTSSRAVSRAGPAPWSSSTRASARSMPAVMPAEVITCPSRTKSGSDSTVTAG
ncbi:hypothetical protein ACH4TM_11945 [Streptomyces parvus]|uniref:hypothetical protein n=1 Tax=Streptomyces parvus TaxID=66428 RepID=UPI0037ACB166